MTEAAPAEAPPSEELTRGYLPDGHGAFDEMIDADGAIRSHWLPLITALNAFPPGECQRRSARLEARVRETGIAYDIFADPNESGQPWQLDLVPIVISPSEWRFLEAALVQRARLFDAILADVYGERRLLREGLIPADLIFSDGAFLRSCEGILPRAGGLRFYAADLARDESGRWRVIDNHTETPAGLGFALANRVVHTHIVGDVFKDVNAVRLAAYFRNLQRGLAAHSERESARIALLTPGAHHRDYFSHSYLARYLGYLLVEGSDLRTKGGNVYLKTLEGLQEIDLIVRCADGRAVDPLELDPTEFLGPAGLMRACRKSPRLVVNAIGSALAQNRGLGPYLPQLCRHLLGEELMLPEAPRHWLGDVEACRAALANLDAFTIRSAQEGTGRPGQAALGREAHLLTEAERELLRREIELFGARLVAEEKAGFSTAPSWNGSELVAKPFAARFFIARMEAGYEAMPGGLAMTIDPEHAVALSAPESHTRDVWVLSDAQQAPHVSLWRPMLENARVQRSQRVIQSRVADDLFWLGRYSERADWTMRVLRSALRRIEEDNGPGTGLRAACRCLETLAHNGGAQAGPSGRAAAGRAVEHLCAELIRSPRGKRTLEQTVASLYRVAFVTRDRLSLEAWQTLSQFRPGDPWGASLAAASPATMLDLLDQGLLSLAAFNGLTHENMTRNYGWSFLDMGRRIERAYNLAEAILSLFVPMPAAEDESGSLLLLLELADSFITYRSRYRLDPMLALVLDLLVLDDTNPRSLCFQLEAVSRHMEGLPDAKQGASLAEDRRLLLAALTSIRLADVEAIEKEEEDGATLERLMREQLALLPELSNALGRHYFNLTDETPHRVQTRVEPRS